MFRFSAPSLQDRMVATQGKSSGFDYLRLGLALIIVAYHTAVVTGGEAAQQRVLASGLGHPIRLLLPLFFALSGFLVAGSLQRCANIGVFLGLRALRIFPALAVDTLFCALVLGPIVTTMAVSAYAADPTFHAYFLNILGIIHYELPGVFASNPMTQVNGQLWTVPFELECYVVLAVLGAVGLHRRPVLLVAVVAALAAAVEYKALASAPYLGRLLLLCFLAGVVLHAWRRAVPWSASLAAVALVLSTVLMAIPSTLYLAALPVAYLTVWLGLLNPPKVSLLRTGDYSYGLFLYGFPLQQWLVAEVPFARVWWGNLLLAWPLALGFAALSWHLFEKRALAQKTHLVRLNDWLTDQWQRLRGVTGVTR